MSESLHELPTQTRRPWRATLRTVAATAIAALPLLPVLASSLGLDTIPVVASVLAGTAGVARFLADPRTERFLRLYLPSLAADPQNKRERRTASDLDS